MVEVVGHPHTREREMLLDVEDMYGPIDGLIGVAPKLLSTPGGLDWGITERGAFNDYVYVDLLGFNEEEIAGFREEGII